MAKILYPCIWRLIMKPWGWHTLILFLNKVFDTKKLVLRYFHSASCVGNLGIKKTLELTGCHAWWPRRDKDVQDYVSRSLVSMSKYERVSWHGLLWCLTILHKKGKWFHRGRVLNVSTTSMLRDWLVAQNGRLCSHYEEANCQFHDLSIHLVYNPYWWFTWNNCLRSEAPFEI